MSRFFRAAALGTAIFSIVPAALAQVDHIFTMELITGVDMLTDEQFFEDEPNFHTSSVTTATGSATASGQMGFGVNKVFSHIESLDSSNPAGDLVADAYTHWGDLVTISDPNLNGTEGTFTASLNVFGNANFSITGAYTESFNTGIYGWWDSWIGTSFDGGDSWLVDGWFGEWQSDLNGGLDYVGDELNQPLTEIEVHFIYGEEFLLGGFLETYVDAFNFDLEPGTIDATLDFSHSAYWNGISNFYDSNGNVVQGVNMTSASGTNYLQPVPEPGSMAILGLGLAALLRRRRAR